MKDEAEREREDLLRRIGAWLDVPMAILAVLWAVVIILELAAPLPPSWARWMFGLDTLIWLAFLAEFLVEILIAPHKLRYLRTHWLVAISVAIPFFRVVRIIRAIGALRGLSLVRIVLGVNRATRAAEEFLARRRFQYVAFVDAVVAFVGAAAVYYFERDAAGASITTFGDSLWWAATLVTTINVQFEPVTFEGRVIAFLIRIVGLATFGYITASLASYLIGRDSTATEATQEKAGEQAQLQGIQAEVAALQQALDRLESQIDRIAPRQP